jgi:DNA polymerase III subunit beta
MTMHLKMDRENLLKAVARTLGVVDRRGPMVILSHFLLEAKDDQVAVAATDLEVSFKGFFPAEVLEPGALTLPAHYLHNLIKELPGTSLDLTGTESSKVKVQAGESRYQLIGLPADQFPPVPEIADLTLVEVDSAVLKEMIEKTIFSVSVDDLQYHLSGIFWERLETPEGFQLRMVSTDGHRLTLIERPLPESEQFAIDEGILIPRKGVAEIVRLLAEEEKVGLGLSKKSLALQTDSKYLFHPAVGEKVSRLPAHHPGDLQLSLRPVQAGAVRNHPPHLAVVHGSLPGGGAELRGRHPGGHLSQPGGGGRSGGHSPQPGRGGPDGTSHADRL